MIPLKRFQSNYNFTIKRRTMNLNPEEVLVETRKPTQLTSVTSRDIFEKMLAEEQSMTKWITSPETGYSQSFKRKVELTTEKIKTQRNLSRRDLRSTEYQLRQRSPEPPEPIVSQPRRRDVEPFEPDHQRSSEYRHYIVLGHTSKKVRKNLGKLNNGDTDRGEYRLDSELLRGRTLLGHIDQYTGQFVGLRAPEERDFNPERGEQDTGRLDPELRDYINGITVGAQSEVSSKITSEKIILAYLDPEVADKKVVLTLAPEDLENQNALVSQRMVIGQIDTKTLLFRPDIAPFPGYHTWDNYFANKKPYLGSLDQSKRVVQARSYSRVEAASYTLNPGLSSSHAVLGHIDQITGQFVPKAGSMLDGGPFPASVVHLSHIDPQDTSVPIVLDPAAGPHRGVSRKVRRIKGHIDPIKGNFVAIGRKRMRTKDVDMNLVNKRSVLGVINPLTRKFVDKETLRAKRAGHPPKKGVGCKLGSHLVNKRVLLCHIDVNNPEIGYVVAPDVGDYDIEARFSGKISLLGRINPNSLRFEPESLPTKEDHRIYEALVKKKAVLGHINPISKKFVNEVIPGPGSYQLNNIEFTKNRVLFGYFDPKRPTKAIIVQPGVGDYEIDSYLVKKKCVLGHIDPITKKFVSEISPGIGDYEVDCKIMKKRVLLGYINPKKATMFIKSVTPGPACYKVSDQRSSKYRRTPLGVIHPAARTQSRGSGNKLASPGPGDYDTEMRTSLNRRTTLGYINPLPRSRSRSKSRENYVTPGPGDYETQGMTSKSRRSLLGVFCKERKDGTDIRSLRNSPGPGYYHTEVSPSFSKARYGKMGNGRRSRVSSREKTPGPGEYFVENCRTSINRRSTLGRIPRGQKQLRSSYCSNSSNPDLGPGSYDTDSLLIRKRSSGGVINPLPSTKPRRSMSKSLVRLKSQIEAKIRSRSRARRALKQRRKQTALSPDSVVYKEIKPMMTTGEENSENVHPSRQRHQGHHQTESRNKRPRHTEVYVPRLPIVQIQRAAAQRSRQRIPKVASVPHFQTRAPNQGSNHRYDEKPKLDDFLTESPHLDENQTSNTIYGNFVNPDHSFDRKVDISPSSITTKKTHNKAESVHSAMKTFDSAAAPRTPLQPVGKLQAKTGRDQDTTTHEKKLAKAPPNSTVAMSDKQEDIFNTASYQSESMRGGLQHGSGQIHASPTFKNFAKPTTFSVNDRGSEVSELEINSGILAFQSQQDEIKPQPPIEHKQDQRGQQLPSGYDYRESYKENFAQNNGYYSRSAANRSKSPIAVFHDDFDPSEPTPDFEEKQLDQIYAKEVVNQGLEDGCNNQHHHLEVNFEPAQQPEAEDGFQKAAVEDSELPPNLIAQAYMGGEVPEDSDRAINGDEAAFAAGQASSAGGMPYVHHDVIPETVEEYYHSSQQQSLIQQALSLDNNGFVPQVGISQEIPQNCGILPKSHEIEGTIKQPSMKPKKPAKKKPKKSQMNIPDLTFKKKAKATGSRAGSRAGSRGRQKTTYKPRRKSRPKSKLILI